MVLIYKVDVYCNVEWWSLLCWLYITVMYIAMCYGCHCSVRSILQSADVLCCNVLQRVVIVITKLVVYCNVLWLSLLYWLYIALIVMTKFVIYCSVLLLS